MLTITADRRVLQQFYQTAGLEYIWHMHDMRDTSTLSPRQSTCWSSDHLQVHDMQITYMCVKL